MPLFQALEKCMSTKEQRGLPVGHQMCENMHSFLACIDVSLGVSMAQSLPLEDFLGLAPPNNCI